MLNSYWEYAGTRYKNKFRAIDAANGKIRRITFHAYEDVAFDNYTWSIEPATSLKQLQKERALQLRDTYAYLKLWFSGGADSTTMLNTFLQSLLKKHLNKKEYEVIRMSYGLDCPRASAKEIADALQIKGSSSYVRVSQLKKQAVDKLIDNVDHSQVLDYL